MASATERSRRRYRRQALGRIYLGVELDLVAAADVLIAAGLCTDGQLQDRDHLAKIVTDTIIPAGLAVIRKEIRTACDRRRKSARS